MFVKNYKELVVWQKSMKLANEVHNLLKKLPKEEVYTLGSQMRRAMISIPSNIAEGQDRNSTKEYIHFLSISRGSKSELETQLLLCIDFKYISYEEAKQALSLTNEIGKMLNTMINTLTEKLNNKKF